MANERPISPVNGQPLPEGKPFTPGETAREMGRRGAKKTNEIKRVRKTLREELIALLTEEITEKGTGRKLEAQTAISTALLQQALKGNTKAFEIIRDTIGEKPAEDIRITAPDMTALDEAFAGASDDA